MFFRYLSRSIALLLLSFPIMNSAYAKLLIQREINGEAYEFRLFELDSEEMDVDLAQNGTIYADAVTQFYRHEAKLKLEDLNSEWTSEDDYKNWVDTAIADEEEICRTGKALCIQVQKNGKAVAWASYEDDASLEGAVYIRQMMVTPKEQGRGLGGALLNEVIPIVRPESVAVYLITRRVNTKAEEFYTKNGFSRSSYIHSGYDRAKYIGLERFSVQ